MIFKRQKKMLNSLNDIFCCAEILYYNYQILGLKFLNPSQRF